MKNQKCSLGIKWLIFAFLLVSLVSMHQAYADSNIDILYPEDEFISTEPVTNISFNFSYYSDEYESASCDLVFSQIDYIIGSGYSTFEIEKRLPDELKSFSKELDQKILISPFEEIPVEPVPTEFIIGQTDAISNMESTIYPYEEFQYLEGDFNWYVNCTNDSTTVDSGSYYMIIDFNPPLIKPYYEYIEYDRIYLSAYDIHGVDYSELQVEFNGTNYSVDNYTLEVYESDLYYDDHPMFIFIEFDLPMTWEELNEFRQNNDEVTITVFDLRDEFWNVMEPQNFTFSIDKKAPTIDINKISSKLGKYNPFVFNATIEDDNEIIFDYIQIEKVIDENLTEFIRWEFGNASYTGPSNHDEFYYEWYPKVFRIDNGSAESEEIYAYNNGEQYLIDVLAYNDMYPDYPEDCVLRFSLEEPHQLVGSECFIEYNHTKVSVTKTFINRSSGEFHWLEGEPLTVTEETKLNVYDIKDGENILVYFAAVDSSWNYISKEFSYIINNGKNTKKSGGGGGGGSSHSSPAAKNNSTNITNITQTNNTTVIAPVIEQPEPEVEVVQPPIAEPENAVTGMAIAEEPKENIFASIWNAIVAFFRYLFR